MKPSFLLTSDFTADGYSNVAAADTTTTNAAATATTTTT
jgi:hypothetical protein